MALVFLRYYTWALYILRLYSEYVDRKYLYSNCSLSEHIVRWEAMSETGEAMHMHAFKHITSTEIYL
ncbi:hypothetical protein CPC08DRAFT_281584 [Agrocybe pediades]|nr:hypothetical protein CPC08DRAFT_281584 [Agrocybe pediades]